MCLGEVQQLMPDSIIMFFSWSFFISLIFNASLSKITIVYGVQIDDGQDE